MPTTEELFYNLGELAFSDAGPSTWNALPDNIRTVADLVKFRKLLKSNYFITLLYEFRYYSAVC